MTEIKYGCDTCYYETSYMNVSNMRKYIIAIVTLN